ncbi:PEP-CTERM sorting domain-containing protein [Akkermansiaceae bacterium]|nr:PEP-CTERM sorting domain-containing protein [Akkermansiaceae bacterium]MDB4274598.1 PEP-CTERM sorting domain-containing protein [Akkermansiaceae bacterium]MDB4570195.1 PEP-CTERM sorting domain-containing protein [Akkermansiaceae bacterium]
MKKFCLQPSQKHTKMKKIYLTPIACLLTAGSSYAATAALDVPTTDGDVAASLVVTTNIVDPSGATFDVSYTLDGIGGLVHVDGFEIGVHSVPADDGGTVNAQNGQQKTMEGNDAEGMSFTGITISNFQPNGSGFVVGDITDLGITSMSLSAIGNNQDQVDISYDNFASSHNLDLNPLLVTVSNLIDLTVIPNYPSTAPTDLYIRPSAANAVVSNRWSFNGLEVTYAIPEPSTSLLFGLGFAGLMARRRRL